MMETRDILLDYVFEYPVRVADLVREDAPSNFNRPSFVVNEYKILESLFELYELGYVLFYADIEGVRKEPEGFSEIDREWLVSMSDKGGCRWEELFKPNWNKYIFVEGYYIEEYANERMRFTIKCGDKNMLMDILSSLSGIIISGSLSSVSIVTPWKPTYWKMIKKCFSVDFDLFDSSLDIIAAKISEFRWRNKLRLDEEGCIAIQE